MNEGGWLVGVSLGYELSGTGKRLAASARERRDGAKTGGADRTAGVQGGQPAASGMERCKGSGKMEILA
jgi:hypothetical protein